MFLARIRPISLRHRSPLPLRAYRPIARSFHVSPPRRDVLFLSIPALKSGLLTITRVTLLTLPFIWRWRIYKTHRRISLALVQIPILALCLVFALGLDQAPRTDRWRLLMMSEAEEMAWSKKRSEDQLLDDAHLLLPPDSPESLQVSLIATKLIQTLVASLSSSTSEIVSVSGWWDSTKSPSQTSQHILDAYGAGVASEEDFFWERGGRQDGDESPAWKKAAKRERERRGRREFRLTDEEEEKVIKIEGGWKIYVLDKPTINAFALPSKELFVDKGLVDLLEDDHLVAAVLAHEIAHVTQRHAVENIGFLNVVSVFFDIIRGVSYALTLSFPLITDGVAVSLNYINDIIAHRAFSRKLEMEADSVGLEFMAMADFDPRAAHALWDLFDAAKEEAGPSSPFDGRVALLDTHPTSQARQDNIEKLMPAAMETWRETRRKLKVEKARDEAKKGIAETEDAARVAHIPKVVDEDVG